MNKYQVIIYSFNSNSRYSYFVKVPNLGNMHSIDEQFQAVNKVHDKHSFLFDIQVDEIDCRKIK